MKFKVGQVLLTRGNAVYMKLVRWRNKIVWGEEGYSHAGIITEVKEATIEVAEALGTGYSIKDYEKWWVENKLNSGEYVLLESIEKLKDVKIHAFKYDGTSYPWWDIIKLTFRWLFNIDKTQDSNSSRRVFCSEAVVKILYDSSNKKIDFQKEYDEPWDSIEPMHLYYSKQLRKVENGK